MTASQLPNVLTELEKLIDLRVDARLRALGAIQSAPGPRELRIAKGVDVADLAARSGVSRVTVGRLEAGKLKRPRVETLNALARALAIPESTYRAAVAGMLQRGAA